MKKSLLCAAVALSGMTLGATPAIYTDLPVAGISPNGRYMLSEIFESLTLIDLTTGQRTLYADDGSMTRSFSAGVGNCVANDGTFVGNYTMTSPAAIFRDGEYKMLPTKNRDLPGVANGITPDGRVICGTQRNRGVSEMDNEVLSVPCVWELNDDGNYSLPTMLPCPKLDFTGRPPQLVTAVRISDDGNTVVGQVRDYGGWTQQPIVYTRGEDGSWSYTLVHPELLNPDDVKFPPDPGEGPALPNIQEYMTADEINEYNLAVEEWERNAAITGYEDYSTYPNEEDFMSDDSLNAYDEAVAIYNKANQEWSVEYWAFRNAYDKCLEKGCAFLFNNVFLSADGSFMAMTNRKTEGSLEGGNQVSYDTPYIFNLKEGTYSFNPEERNSTISSMGNDGTLFVYNANYYYRNADVRTPDGKLMTLTEYVEGKSPAVADWMKSNMYHDMEVYDYATMTWVKRENVPCLGMAVATPDMKLIATTVTNEWYEDESVEYYTYLLDIDGQLGGVEAVGAPREVDATFRTGGVMELRGDVAEAAIFDMQGRLVWRADRPSGVVSTGLGAGLYIARLKAASGAVVTVKGSF